jgi:hypothetical protein
VDFCFTKTLGNVPTSNALAMKIALVHNPRAGNAMLEPNELRRRFENAGFDSLDFSFFDQIAVETFACRQVVDQRGEAIGKMHGCDGRPIRNRKGQSFFNQKALVTDPMPEVDV